MMLYGDDNPYLAGLLYSTWHIEGPQYLLTVIFTSESQQTMCQNPLRISFVSGIVPSDFRFFFYHLNP